MQIPVPQHRRMLWIKHDSFTCVVLTKKITLVSTRKNCISMHLSRAWCLFLVVLRFALRVCCKFAQQERQLLWSELHTCIEVYLRKVSKFHILCCGQPQPTKVYQIIFKEYHTVQMLFITQVGCSKCLRYFTQDPEVFTSEMVDGFLLPVPSSKRRCFAPFMSCHCQI